MESFSSFEYQSDEDIFGDPREGCIPFDNDPTLNEVWSDDSKDYKMVTSCTKLYSEMFMQVFEYMDWIDLKHQSIKSALKTIVNELEDSFKSHELVLLDDFVSLYPLEEKKQTPILDFSFYNKKEHINPKYDFLRFSVVDCLINAAICFLKAAGNKAVKINSGDDSYIILSKTIDATIYVVSEESIRQLLSPKEGQPLLYIFDSYKSINARNIIVYYDEYLSDSELSPYETREITDIINYFLRLKKRINQPIEFEIVSYKSFFKEMPQEKVDFFFQRLVKCISDYKTSVNSIGTLLEKHDDHFLESFALSSNHYIGSKYNVEDTLPEYVKQRL